MDNRLRELRRAKGLTQRYVARELRIDHSLVSRHEAGTRRISPTELRQYAGLYGVSERDIYRPVLSDSAVWVDPVDIDVDVESAHKTARIAEASRTYLEMAREACDQCGFARSWHCPPPSAEICPTIVGYRIWDADTSTFVESGVILTADEVMSQLGKKRA